jgi:opacity protein-like surface antigen
MKSVQAAALLIAFSAAAPAVASDDSQVWANTTATVKLSDHWRFSEDVTTRFSDHRDGLYEIEMNSLLGYVVGKGVTVWAGYTHDPNYSAGHFTIMEHRAREQVTVDKLATIGTGRLSGRFRMEQRWRDGLAGTGWRVRPYLKYTLPFHKGGKTAFVFSEEAFFNLNTTTFQRTDGLDKTRTFVGLSTPLSKNITAEAGYLNQHTFVRNGPDTDDHVASIALSFAL